MALELLGCMRKGGKYHAPTMRVRCSGCGTEYARTGWPGDIKRSSCGTCAQRPQPNRRYANSREKKRAANARYYQRRKLRGAES